MAGLMADGKEFTAGPEFTFEFSTYESRQRGEWFRETITITESDIASADAILIAGPIATTKTTR